MYESGQQFSCEVLDSEPQPSVPHIEGSLQGYSVRTKEALPGFVVTSSRLTKGQQITAWFVVVHRNRLLLSDHDWKKTDEISAYSTLQDCHVNARTSLVCRFRERSVAVHSLIHPQNSL
jgi:hypothetical protein